MVNGSKQVPTVGDGAPRHLDARLIAAVTQRLGVPVRIVLWDEHRPTGAKIPVFAVPADKVAEARALGLEARAA